MASHIFDQNGRILATFGSLKRFWQKVDRSGDCWEWNGGKGSSGHGRFKLNSRLYSPHRISFELFNGNIANDLMVCHRCNNPGCVNPRHLYAGTRSQNTQDTISAGTWNKPQGRQFKPTKLDAGQVTDIRIALRNGATVKGLARKYNVSPRSIQLIRDRRTWKQVA